MIELRFRAWDKEDGVMFYTIEDEFGRMKADRLDKKYGVIMEGSITVIARIHPPLMQFTGLLDKNGKEIFEGDITKDSTGLCVIVWNDRLASFSLRRNGWAFDHFFGEAVDPKDVEIIGNVHEHPAHFGKED